MAEQTEQKQNKVVQTPFPFRVQCKASSWSLTKSKPPTCTSSAVWVPGQEHPAAAWFEEPFQAERGKHGGGDQGAPRFRKVLRTFLKLENTSIHKRSSFLSLLCYDS